MLFFLPALLTLTARHHIPARLIKVNPIWVEKGVADDADAHVALRGQFVSGEGDCTLRITGYSEYLVWLDGKLIDNGPSRFPRAFPEYQTLTLHVGSGRHVLAVHVHNEGISTSTLSQIPPFLWCRLEQRGIDLPIGWRGARIPGYRARTKRISGELGWIEWLDTAQVWANWQEPDFDDSAWPWAVSKDPGIGPLVAAKTKPVRLNVLPIKPIAQGKLTENFGYEQDPTTRFFLRDLDPRDLPAQGVWRRYDLGRVRLGRPKITLDLLKGATVEFATCEQLRHGRVHAWITLSNGMTCNLDHYTATGGPQEFMPMTPKGGRFLEVHILTPGKVSFLKEEFLERTYYGDPEGSFECDDALLNKIWRVGVDTVRACSEDSLVDCPSRERAEWTGDVASVATDICGVAWSDLSLSRRGLVQPTQVARGDGLVAGVGPGSAGYLSTYAAQWATACVHYWEMTGDKSLLEELWPAAERNIAAFRAKMTPQGLSDDLGWAFVDWGYVRNEGPSDMALNLHYLMALRSMVRWQQAVGQPSATDYQALANEVERIVRAWLRERLSLPGGWKNVGFHHAALALLTGLVDKAEERNCIQRIETHLMGCFPNNPNGPRLADPGFSDPQVMTPYFGHFALAALLEHGETNFVLGQYRKCWGWALGDGRTTWLEVFDPRWSHCHEWSGCPTWQLSRYILGIRPRFDVGDGVFDVQIQSGSKLKRASGTIPVPGGGLIRVSWTAEREGYRLLVESDRVLHLRIAGKLVEVNRKLETFLPRK